MRRFALRTTTALAVVATVVSLAACASPAQEELTWEDSPLQRYFASFYSMGFDEEQTKERDRRMQELIAQCMKNEGFEYYPVVSDAAIDQPMPIEPGDGENLWQPEKREWVEQYGYGIVNDPYRLNGGYEPVPRPMPMPMPEPNQNDPNMEYFESLSESEQRAYNEALYGKSSWIDPGFGREGDIADDEQQEYDPEDFGCYGKANAEVYADMMELGKIWEDPQFAAVFQAQGTLYEKIEADPKRVALDRQWADCVADAGQPVFTRRYEAESSIHSALEPHFNKENWDESIWDLPEVQEIGRQEIALALVDFDCRKKVDYDNEILRLQFAIEEQFLSDYKVELEALKQAFEQAMGS